MPPGESEWFFQQVRSWFWPVLKRIQQREKSVGVWVHLDEDQALEQARE